MFILDVVHQSEPCNHTLPACSQAHEEDVTCQWSEIPESRSLQQAAHAVILSPTLSGLIYVSYQPTEHSESEIYSDFVVFISDTNSAAKP